MQRTVVLVALVVLVVGAVGPVSGAALQGSAAAGQAGTPTTASNDSVAPGARLGGVVAVQKEEVQGDLEGRAFGIRIARAHSNASRADIVAEQVHNLSRRTAEIRDRRRALESAHENGTLSTGRFHAEMAGLAVRNAVVHQQINRTETASRDLPADVLGERGINVTAIDRLRHEARDASGPEAADIARTIAGRDVGHGLAGDEHHHVEVRDRSGRSTASDAGSNETATSTDERRTPGGRDGPHLPTSGLDATPTLHRPTDRTPGDPNSTIFGGSRDDSENGSLVDGSLVQWWSP